MSEALVLALSREEQDAVHSRWTDSYPPDHELAIKLSELSGDRRILRRIHWLRKNRRRRYLNRSPLLGIRDGLIVLLCGVYGYD